MTYLDAIIEHFGLPVGRVFPHMGAPFGGVALMIQLSAEDHARIGQIMADATQTDHDGAQRAIWRQEYNALPPADRAVYGSFAGFVEAHGGVDPFAPTHSSWSVDGKPLADALAQREVEHVDTPDEEPAGLPPHVWLYRNMLTEQQAIAPLGRDETNGQYAVAIDQLTDAQRAIPYVARQIPPKCGRLVPGDSPDAAEDALVDRGRMMLMSNGLYPHPETRDE